MNDYLDDFMKAVAELEASRIPPVSGIYGWYYTEDGLIPITAELLDELLDEEDE